MIIYQLNDHYLPLSSAVSGEQARQMIKKA
jgi:hypothetical protein